jgi:hypothetical protein
MTIMGLGPRRVGAIHSKKVSFADYTPPERQDHEKDFKFYMKNFRDQVPQTTWNKFTRKQQQIILEAGKKSNRGNTGTTTVQTQNFKRKVSATAREQSSHSSRSLKTFPRLMEQLQQLNTTVSALTSRVATINADNGEDNSIGNQFGGQAAAKRYNVSGVDTSGHRRVSQLHSVSKDLPLTPFYGSVELDTHADTCVVGKNFVVFSFTGRECDVYPFSQQYEAVQNIHAFLGLWSGMGM